MNGAPSFTNIPNGIIIAKPHRGRLIMGISGDGRQDDIAYEVHGDGSVTCDDGWEPVIEDGFIKHFRALDGS